MRDHFRPKYLGMTGQKFNDNSVILSTVNLHSIWKESYYTFCQKHEASLEFSISSVQIIDELKVDFDVKIIELKVNFWCPHFLEKARFSTKAESQGRYRLEEALNSPPLSTLPQPPIWRLSTLHPSLCQPSSLDTANTLKQKASFAKMLQEYEAQILHQEWIYGWQH